MPSRPAKGESLTEKVISKVGAEILTNSMGSGAEGAQTVSPMVMSPMPLMAMISPAAASVTGIRFSPSKVYRDTALAFRGWASGAW